MLVVHRNQGRVDRLEGHLQPRDDDLRPVPDGPVAEVAADLNRRIDRLEDEPDRRDVGARQATGAAAEGPGSNDLAVGAGGEARKALAGGDVDGVVPLREVDPERPGPLQGFDLIVRRGPDGGVRQEQLPEPSGAVEIGRGEAETVAAVRTLAQSALDGEALKRVAGRKGRRPDEVDAVELAA